MARPLKAGLDYFPLDVNIDSDDKMELVMASHGVVGYGVLIKILCKVYDNGYYYEWGEREKLLTSKRLGVDIEKVDSIVSDSLKWGFFSSELFDKFGILTSRGVQKRYLEATTRRNEIELKKEYLLVSEDEISSYKNIKIVNDDINQVNDDINQVNDDISTQSKVKEIESKKKDNITDLQSVYDHYISLGLRQHRTFTEAMKNAIKKAMKQNKYTIEECKILLDRHKKIVEITKKNEKPVQARQLDVFFGTKAYQASHLICAEYEEGGKLYENYLKKENKKPFSGDMTPTLIAMEQEGAF